MRRKLRSSTTISPAFTFLMKTLIGKRITFDDGESWISIVGVIGDVKQLGLDSSAKPEVYFPYLQAAAPSMSLVVRTPSNPLSLAGAVKSQIQSIDKDLPIDEAKTMQQLLAESISGRRFNMLLLTVFARGRARAGHRRYLRRDVLHGDAAYTRDWYSRGHWRSTSRRFPNGDRARNDVGNDWSCFRFGRGFRSYAIDDDHAFWR